MNKVCTVCGVSKPLHDFSKRKLSDDGRAYDCKECVRARDRESSKKFERVLKAMYSQQRAKSKKRGHDMPTYTKEELGNWIVSQENYIKIMTDWLLSDYDTNLKPSIDRIDNSKGYDFKNIELVTWGENNIRGREYRTRCKLIDGKFMEVK